jgi:hypothetical protein
MIHLTNAKGTTNERGTLCGKFAPGDTISPFRDTDEYIEDAIDKGQDEEAAGTELCEDCYEMGA